MGTRLKISRSILLDVIKRAEAEASEELTKVEARLADNSWQTDLAAALEAIADQLRKGKITKRQEAEEAFRKGPVYEVLHQGRPEYDLRDAKRRVTRLGQLRAAVEATVDDHFPVNTSDEEIMYLLGKYRKVA